MKSLLAVALSLVVGLGFTEAADKQKLVGVWEVVVSEGVPKGEKVEFTTDGKVFLSGQRQGKEFRLQVGTYKLEDDKLTLIGKSKDGKDDIETETIKMLDNEKVVILNKNGKIDEFKRVK